VARARPGNIAPAAA